LRPVRQALPEQPVRLRVLLRQVLEFLLLRQAQQPEARELAQ
jgi:hypothetical protein